jgi:putative Holliday junction resolvase
MRRPGDELPVRGRLVAYDLGRVRVGVAVSDPDQIVASPSETLDVADLDLGAQMDVDALGRRLALHARACEAAGVVVGAPLALDGAEGPAAREARAVADVLRSESVLPVRLVDERFTTTEAERSLIEGDVRRRARRDVVDRVAASVLLQGVLSAQAVRRGDGS